ncbi:alpha/beta hydrolase-fold protein [Solimonas terrae]|uniref:Alpha/beta hydrolase n=1 Tax=Solimonas terrae TaxID=1396819 RepID=A0A6M2BTP6_9GAMM|nr:alpha/beta hydrolase-fold protein [Solimonas terrae]NGY05581.1 hypothetical protein [Solimonas terrae]
MRIPEPTSLHSAAPFTLALDAAASRLDGIERFPAAELGSAGIVRLSVATPTRRTRGRRRRYPLLILLDGEAIFGSAVEMSRLMAQTRELHECIVLAIDCAADERETARRVHELLRWSGERYRIAGNDVALFGAGRAGGHAIHALHHVAGLAAAIASAPAHCESAEQQPAADAQTRRLLLYAPIGSSCRALIDGMNAEVAISHAAPGWPVADLVRGLRTLWSTGVQGGKGYEVFGRAWLRPVLLAASAPLSLARKWQGRPPSAGNPHRIRSRSLERDFELLAVLPEPRAVGHRHALPAVLVLDANLEFSTAAEAAHALAAAGVSDDAVVVGIGVPRSESTAEFAFRRFEEFSPPLDGYDFSDGMGRIMRGLFALRGQDARERLGKAPLLYRFLCDEVLPLLHRHYCIDPQRISLLGHSAGGAFSCYALLQQDSPFSGYAGISPGIGMSGFWLRRQLAAGAAPAPSARTIVLSIGEEEDEGESQGSGISQTAEFARQLRARARAEISYHCYDGESHASTYPRAVTQALRKLLGRAGD